MIKYIAFGLTIIGIIIVLVLLICALLGIDVSEKFMDNDKH